MGGGSPSTAQYEGNDDVYVMAAMGGEPVRLTWHPMPDQVIGWTADGKIVFRSPARHAAQRQPDLHNRAEAHPSMVPLEPAAWISSSRAGSGSPTRDRSRRHNWKATRAARRRDYIGTTDPMSFKEATNWTARTPSRCGPRTAVYFVTDRGAANLASMNRTAAT